MPVPHEELTNLRVFDHPLIREKLSRIRDAHTSHADFRRMLNEIAALMLFGASRHLPLRETEVETPLERTVGYELSRPITLIPILRAGIAMTDGILSLVPDARVGHIGVYRDERTLKPVEYYAKMPPDIAESDVFVIDPMLATGGSASHVIKILKSRGCTSIRMICLVAAPQGVQRLLDNHPEVEVFVAGLDRTINERGYILPGLGDAGDRIFGTQ